MARKCSNCGIVGHNSRGCTRLKLFGVPLNVSSPSAVATTKNASMDCLDSSRVSDAGVQEKKKWIPWTEEEHSSFLVGLEKLGKGRWTKISRQYVATKTPAQVSSHAQKYFLRQNALDKKKPSGLSDTVNAEGSETKQSQPTVKSSENPVSFQGELFSSSDSSTVLLNNFQLRSSVENQ